MFIFYMNSRIMKANKIYERYYYYAYQKGARKNIPLPVSEICPISINDFLHFSLCAKR